MRLSEIMSNAGLAIYAEIALVIFLLVFSAVALRLLFGNKKTWDDARYMPLDDENPQQPRPVPGSDDEDDHGGAAKLDAAASVG